MRGTDAVIEQAGTRRQQGAGADRHQRLGFPHMRFQPGDNVRIAVSMRLRPAARRRVQQRRGITRQHDHRIIRHMVGQRLDAADGQADGRGDTGQRADIAHVEMHRALFQIGLAQHLHRSGNVQQQRPCGHHHQNIDMTGLLGLHAASACPAPFNASSTVTIRAKRPASTSSVRARISSALKMRPAALVMAKVSVASET